MTIDYAHYRTREAAENALWNAYGDGSICEGERPHIECRVHKTASWSKTTVTYTITLTYE